MLSASDKPTPDIQDHDEPRWSPPQNDQETRRPANSKLLPAKLYANSQGSMYYRADYELRWLRVAKRQRNAWSREFAGAEDAHDIASMAIASKHLLDWCEREAAVLRIAKPAAQVQKAAKFSDRLDQDRSPTLLDVVPSVGADDNGKAP
jgi:hypothetical protein